MKLLAAVVITKSAFIPFKLFCTDVVVRKPITAIYFETPILIPKIE